MHDYSRCDVNHLYIPCALRYCSPSILPAATKYVQVGRTWRTVSRAADLGHLAGRRSVGTWFLAVLGRLFNIFRWWSSLLERNRSPEGVDVREKWWQHAAWTCLDWCAEVAELEKGMRSDKRSKYKLPSATIVLSNNGRDASNHGIFNIQMTLDLAPTGRCEEDIILRNCVYLMGRRLATPKWTGCEPVPAFLFVSPLSLTCIN